MNIPDIYIIEPYNAYAPKGGRKKHWTEIVEEQALILKIIEEARLNTNTTTTANHTATTATTTGTPAVAAVGAGGSPPVEYFNPHMSASFGMSATTASAPVTIVFTNQCHSDLQLLGSATFSWSFGDGTNTTDNVNVNPSHKYTTTGSNFFVILSARSVNTNNLTASSTQSLNITAPTVIANFTAKSGSISGSSTSITASHPAVIGFINSTSTNNSQNVISYIWNFGSGLNPTSSLTNPSFTYNTAGTYTVQLQATGSFGITSAKTLIAVNAT